MDATACLSASGTPKKRYESEAAAHRDLAHSHRWRRRAEWPVPFWCRECHGWHLAHKS